MSILEHLLIEWDRCLNFMHLHHQAYICIITNCQTGSWSIFISYERMHCSEWLLVQLTCVMISITSVLSYTFSLQSPFLQLRDILESWPLVKNHQIKGKKSKDNLILILKQLSHPSQFILSYNQNSIRKGCLPSFITINLSFAIC